ncbi:farnesoate epoxidase [Plutella xylostella]|uniref:farnesoate epoxidase n=1 Tax=Plutella xylostella TaxID=51655 RepID=UPI002032BF13|nr:farnesoate epoxidase [Plutella xylostella]
MWWFTIFTFIVGMSVYMWRTPKFYPPGPMPLPIIGNLFSVWLNLRRLKYHHVVWQEWSRQYGEVLGLQLGSINLVVVSGADRIKEVLSREVFNGRPDGFFYTLRSFGKKIGIVFADGPSWNSTRRVALKYLKTFGYGTASMEALITEECNELIKLRMEDAGEPIEMDHMFDIPVVNILWRIVAGKRYDLKDDRLRKICYLIKRSFKVVDMSGGIINFFPYLRHIIPGYTGYRELKELHHSMYMFIKNVIREHESTIKYDKPRDVIDAFLIEMAENKDRSFTDAELQVVCLDLLQAGMETVSNTAVFLALHCMRDEDVQMRLHREIDDVIGERVPQLADRGRMVYTEAVILEALRISSVAAVGIPHMAVQDAQLGSYIIPRGTFILLALHDLHNGPHWEDPHVFNPERFISNSGKLISPDSFLPFGSGRRRCIGEALARSELFLFLTHLLQSFHLETPPGDPQPSTDPVNGVTLSAKPFRAVFKPRATGFN